MVTLGRCTECGHTQPGTRAGGAVEPFAERGCAACGGRTFVVADDDRRVVAAGRL